MKKIEDILAECIEDIKAGRLGVGDCLARYSPIRQQLEPLLRIALEIKEPPAVKPSPAFKVRARVQLMEQIHAKQAVTKWSWFRRTNRAEPIPHKRRFNLAPIIIAIVLAVFALGGGTAYASQDSLPGDVLYPVKLGIEQARLVLAGSDAAKTELCLRFANSRLEEMTVLAERGRVEKVNIAVNGYDGAIATALEKMEEASGKGLNMADTSEVVAEATLKHIDVLEGLKETTPDEAKSAIEEAIEWSKNGRENAVRVLAGENPVRAMEINLSTMEDRLNRAKGKADNFEEAEGALGEVRELRQFGQEICEIARGLDKDTAALDELVARATPNHLEILGVVYERVPEQSKEAVVQAIGESVRNYESVVEALKERGALGNIPEEPPLPEWISDELKEKLLRYRVSPWRRY